MAGINIAKQIAYWRHGADEDWAVGEHLVRKGMTRHGLFLLHLALEKLLKAYVCSASKDFAPKIHALARLAELGGLAATPAQMDFLADFTRYNLAGRYPEMRGAAPPKVEARAKMRQAREVFEWLQSQL